MGANKDLVRKLCLDNPKTAGFVYRYGTAGFREKAQVLDAVCVRMGMLAWLRAVETQSAVGLMVTASHNPVQDNGLKAVDPDGGMLAHEWEEIATDLVNADDEKVLGVVEEIAKSRKVDLAKSGPPSALVFIGRDTRPHSAKLAKLAIEGVKALGGTVGDIGVVTTPQLHHCVRSKNLESEAHLASVDGYYEKLSTAFHQLVGDRTATEPLVVDAAFGVGGPKFQDLLVSINKDRAILDVAIRNSPTGKPENEKAEAEKLNYGVGAEHVQKKLAFPENTLNLPEERLMRTASFDGDADRIVYLRATKEDKLNLFDGDKIACLLTFFIQKQLAKLPAKIVEGIDLACVQTAYANGASSKYIKGSLKVDAPLTKTGVKYLHHKALEFAIGVYFEANGHGTVLFNQDFISKIKASQSSLETPAAKLAAANILALEQLINQATGDAMADLLAIEAVLMVESLSLDDWNDMYHDLPSRQLKCQVADRTAIITSEDESRVLEPKALQDAIDAAVAKYENGRAFARPSGTEDAVRVYAEATTSTMADELALIVCRAIYDNAGGVGPRP